MANPYLQGNYGPVTEEVTALDLAVTGSLPVDLDGSYLRNGPNPIDVGDPDGYHWFTGDGMVHGVRLRDGRAEWYRNRWVRSGPVADALGEPHRTGAVVGDRDAAPNTNVMRIGNRLLACVESGPRPYELTPELETIGASDMGGTLPAGFTAHPHFDPVAREWHAVNYFWGWGDQVQHAVIGDDGAVTHTRMIDTHGSPMLHDCAISERWTVVMDLPVAFDVEAAMAGERFPYHWQDDYPARFGLVDRHDLDGPVRWIDVDPCYVFHPLNAYDDGDTLVLDAVRWPRMFDGANLGPNESGRATLWRWRLDTVGLTARAEPLSDLEEEFPRADERLTGRRHRYGYGALDLPGTGPHGGGVVKHDLDRGTTEILQLGIGCGANEFVFVPREGSRAEDDGWLVGLTYLPDTDTSDLLVIAADDLTGGPVARVHLPRRVPFGFHGNWVPSADRS